MVTNPTSIHEDEGSIPGSAQWVKGSGIATSCGISHRGGSDLAVLWLWFRPAAAAPTQLLAWELPRATSTALKRQKKKKKKEREEEEEESKLPLTEWGEIFANHISDKGLVFRVHEEFLHINCKKTKNPTKNEQSM